MPDLPRGTVTFLFTDIEGSIALWERDRTAMRVAVNRHLAILQSLIAAHHGVLYKTVGDGTQSAFASVEDALHAAVPAQRALLAEAWADPPGPARARMLPSKALLTRLGKRLPVLTGGTRDLTARQRTLRDASAWCHDLLGTNEQSLFPQLSVLVSGFTLEAAEAVTNDTEDLDAFKGVERLCEQSLLRQEEGLQREPRFHLLEMVREYAVEQLSTSEVEATVRYAHTVFFLELAETAFPALAGPEEGR